MKKEIEKNLQNIALKNSINFDKGQLVVTLFFDKLHQKFVESNSKKNFIQKIFSKKNSDYIKGIYLYGGVGRGKSMIMDLFFQNVPVKKKEDYIFTTL